MFIRDVQDKIKSKQNKNITREVILLLQISHTDRLTWIKESWSITHKLLWLEELPEELLVGLSAQDHSVLWCFSGQSHGCHQQRADVAMSNRRESLTLCRMSMFVNGNLGSSNIFNIHKLFLDITFKPCKIQNKFHTESIFLSVPGFDWSICNFKETWLPGNPLVHWLTLFAYNKKGSCIWFLVWCLRGVAFFPWIWMGSLQVLWLSSTDM